MATTIEEDRTTPRRRKQSLLVTLAWIASLFAGLGGMFVGISGLAAAQSAPQEASAAAIGLLIAIGPYVIARALSELS